MTGGSAGGSASPQTGISRGMPRRAGTRALPFRTACPGARGRAPSHFARHAPARGDARPPISHGMPRRAGTRALPDRLESCQQNVTLSTIERICKRLKCGVGDLFEGVTREDGCFTTFVLHNNEFGVNPR